MDRSSGAQDIWKLISLQASSGVARLPHVTRQRNLRQKSYSVILLTKSHQRGVLSRTFSFSFLLFVPLRFWRVSISPEDWFPSNFSPLWLALLSQFTIDHFVWGGGYVFARLPALPRWWSGNEPHEVCIRVHSGLRERTLTRLQAGGAGYSTCMWYAEWMKKSFSPRLCRKR